MAEPPGSQSALGIEAVEWLPTGESSVTVIVTGRWRRRPSWQGRPVLVIETHGRRHRFPAIPDPPSVAGAAPGTWRMTFSIPAWLAPQLGGRAWLQMGVVVVPLPPVVEPREAGSAEAPEEPGEAEAPQAAGAPEGEAAGAPPEAEDVGAREAEGAEAREFEPDVAETAGITGTEREPQRRTGDLLAAAAELTNTIKELDAERRMAAARAESEQRRRAELERELSDTRQHAQEAQRLAREAELERERILRAPVPMRVSSWRAQLPVEMELAHRAPPVREPAASSSLDGELARLARQQLRREQDATHAAELEHWRVRAAELEHWRARAAELEQQLHESALRAERLYEVIEDLRAVLDIIRGIPPTEARHNPGMVAEGDPPVAGGSSLLEPRRLDAALGRLRESIPPVEADPGEEPQDEQEPSAGGEETATDERELLDEHEVVEELPPPALGTRRSWLLRALRGLAKRDPVTAGRIAFGLLRAQRLASEGPVSYDVSLADVGSFHLSVDERETRLVPAKQLREHRGVDFQLLGDSASFARLLVAGPIRRRSGRGVAELRGDRKALGALLALIRTPYGLRELYAAGARLDPRLTFALIASMIEPRWTSGDRFTVAHRGPGGSVYLRVPGNTRPAVGVEAPLGPVAATIICEPNELLAVFAQGSAERARIRGRREVVEQLRRWVSQAQGS